MIDQILNDVFICVILAKCFEILREPGEILSFWDRNLIGLDETDPIFYKILTCSLCHSGYFAIFSILFFGSSPIVLPATLVVYHFLQTKIYK